jgi:hypothetical protein
VHGGFILPSFSEHRIPFGTRRKRFGNVAEFFRFVSKSLFKGLGVCDMASFLHGAAPFHFEEGGSATGVLITEVPGIAR